MEIIANLLNNINKPHALLVVQNKASSFEHFYKAYLKSIIKTNTEEYRDWEEKIDKNQYHDLIIFNAYKTSVKKEDIITLQELFIRQSVEKARIKAYIIIGIENCSRSVLNPLLKFLEEPPKNTYAIFLCRNLDKVLPTIRSRCAQMFLPEDDKIFDDIYKTYRISKSDGELIKKTYLDMNDLAEDFENKIVTKLLNFVNSLSKNLSDIKKAFENFKKLDYYEISVLLNFLGIRFKRNDLFILKDDLRLNPSKSLLFNKILSLIYEN